MNVHNIASALDLIGQQHALIERLTTEVEQLRAELQRRDDEAAQSDPAADGGD